MEKQYEVMISVGYTVDAEGEDDAKAKAEELLNELQGQHGLAVVFQVGSAECMTAEDEG